MKIDGKFKVSAPRATVWEVLDDPETLRNLVPGAQSLERTGDDEFRARMVVGVGPIKATFDGRLEVVERCEPEYNRMRITGDARQGRITGEATVRAEEVTDDETEVSVSGDVQVSGMIARVGQRMLGGLSQQMMQQFFNDLAREATRRNAS